jgi:UDP-glucose 4-epimerase
VLYTTRSVKMVKRCKRETHSAVRDLDLPLEGCYVFLCMKILLTGGAGFIGSHVAEAYLNDGHEVVILDNLSSGRSENVPDGAKFILMDICSPELGKLFDLEKPDLVNHHAAQISVSVSARDPLLDARSNSLGLLNVLECAVKSGVGRFLFISSGGAIYGEAEQLPTPEDTPALPLSPYAIHKQLGESYLRFYAHEHGLEYAVLRYANVYGPRQNAEGEAGVVALFTTRLLAGQRPVVYAYPEDPEGMGRDYVYVGDVARANLLAAQKLEAKTLQGEIMNIGTGIMTRTGALYREIAAACKSDCIPEQRGPRPGDLRRSCLDISRAARLISWHPEVDLQAGITGTVASFKVS